MTREEVEKLLELESKASGGVWASVGTGNTDGPAIVKNFELYTALEEKYDKTSDDYKAEGNNEVLGCSEWFRAEEIDLEFIATSRNLLRPLCLDWLRLKEENEKMREALDVTLHFGWRENKKFEEWIKGLEGLKKGKFDK